MSIVNGFVVLGAIALTIIAVNGCTDGSSASQDKDVIDAISVREINVCDEEGNVRFRVSATESGAELTFLSMNDERRIQIVADENGTSMIFYETTGAPRLGMVAGTSWSEVILFGQGRKRAVHLLVSDEKDSSAIGIFDSDENPRLSFGTSPDDTSVAIYDEKENVRAVLGTTSSPRERRAESSLALFSETGEVIWESPED